MTTKTSDLRAARDMAGAYYADALRDLRERFIELAALDQALANANVAAEPLNSLTASPDLRPLTHPRFGPRQALDWHDEVVRRRNAYIASVTKERAG